MMGHNFKYALKTLLKNKMLIFWTFAFPIILGTFFCMAFSNIENSEKQQTMEIAIVDNEAFQKNESMKTTFRVLSEEKKANPLFHIQYVNKETAKELLQKEEIIGYLVIEEEPKVVVTKNGINETVLKYVTEEVYQLEETVKQLVEQKISKVPRENQEKMQSLIASTSQKIYKEVAQIMQEENQGIEDQSDANLSYTMIEFYTLIAMSCLYGGILGMVTINRNLANMSHTGKRVAMGAISKGKLIFSSILASYLVQLIGLALLFLYTIFILNVDYGNHLAYTILLALIGSFTGLSFGITIATTLKTSDNTKTGVMISLTMFGCFLSGMMGITMKYIIDKNIPLLNQINPVNRITDGFYALYYYDTFDRFYANVISLLIFSFLMIFLAILHLRRQKYDSI